MSETPKKRKLEEIIGGRKPLSYDLEFELSKWIMEQRNENLCVSRKLIQEKALDMANKKGLTDFKASMTWVQKFMDRNGFTIRRKTTQSQRLPPELSKKVSNFFFYLRKYEKKKMKSALECNPHSNVIRNFWEKKKRNPRIVFEGIG